MNILNLSLGQDTGGQQWRLAKAWRQLLPNDTYTSVTTSKTFYPIENRLDWLRLRNEWWPPADVVHLNNDLRFVERQQMRKLTVKQPKPYVIHHHGTMYRTRPDYHLEALQEYKAHAICSTVDLWAIAPDKTTWLPQCYDREELMEYRRSEYKPKEGVLRVAHAPTNRPIKGTDALANAVYKLKRLGQRIELDIIEGVKNEECLRRKARADVFVDQLILGYGCNAIEAWGMGMPVIAGVDVEGAKAKIRQSIPTDTPDRMLEQWGRYPWYEATEQTLTTALLKMLDPKVRTYWANRGIGHFNKHHAHTVVVPMLRKVYEQAIANGRYSH